MFKLKRIKGKIHVELYSTYNRFLYSAGGFSSKQAAFKNIRATMAAVGGNKLCYVQDETLLEPGIFKITPGKVVRTDLKLWK